MAKISDEDGSKKEVTFDMRADKGLIEEEPIYMSMHPTGYADLGLGNT